MKYFKRKIFYLSMWGAFVPLSAQQLISSAGRNASQEKSNIILGQPSNEPALSLCNQAGLIVNSLKTYKEGKQIYALPNPSIDLVQVYVVQEPEKITIILFNIKGRILEQKNPTGSFCDISFFNYKPGVYILKVYKNNLEAKSFEIIKK